MSGYRLSPSAKKDLDEIWSASANKEGVDFASKVLAEIGERFPVLASMPEGGRLRPEFEEGLRSFPVGEYIIYYRKAKRGGILVSRVVHGKRDQKKAFRAADRKRLQ